MSTSLSDDRIVEMKAAVLVRGDKAEALVYERELDDLAVRLFAAFGPAASVCVFTSDF